MLKTINIFEQSATNSHDSTVLGYYPDQDEVHWARHEQWDKSTNECSDYYGRFRGQDWLNAIATAYLHPKKLNHFDVGNNANPLHVAYWFQSDANEPELSHLFLDSFSIIENGEESKRSTRNILPSNATKAILSLVHNHPKYLLEVASHREFEVMVAAALAEIGFTRVELRRYVKDGGADIIARQ